MRGSVSKRKDGQSSLWSHQMPSEGNRGTAFSRFASNGKAPVLKVSGGLEIVRWFVLWFQVPLIFCLIVTLVL